MTPLCFVLMPFGRKRDDGGREIHFDRVYRELIAPAITAAGLEPIRADEEGGGGIIHKTMFERLMLCDYAVADLTTANANVFYELGIRHGIRPHSTVPIFGEGTRLPFDVALLNGLSYGLDASGQPTEVARHRATLTQRLKDCRGQTSDSPVFQLVSDFPPPDIARLKTDVFRDRVHAAKECKDRLAAARKAGAAAVAAVEAGLTSIVDTDPAVVVDLFLSYRAVKDWQRMVDLEPKMAPELRRATMLREQLGLALNRLGRGDEALAVLETLIAERGPSSETNGILGRVYKDRWEAAVKAGDSVVARGLLRKAIATYLQGFEADWRDAYPGINAVTLMELADQPDPRQARLLPVVRYAVERRLARKAPDYWDYATLLELAVLAEDQPEAETALGDAVAAIREPFEPETTARNLRLIREARHRRGAAAAWIEEMEKALAQAAARQKP